MFFGLKLFRISSRKLSDQAFKLQLKDNLKTQMKAKNKVGVQVIKSVLADILNSEKSGLTKLPSVGALIQKAIKKREESVLAYKEAQRLDLVFLVLIQAESEQQEIDILYTFLPKQLSREEILSVVKEAIENNEKLASNFGLLMNTLNNHPRLDVSVAPRKLVTEVAKNFIEK